MSQPSTPRENASSFDLFSNALPIGAFEVDAGGQCIYLNPTFRYIIADSSYDLFVNASDEGGGGPEPTHEVPSRWLDWLNPEDVPDLRERWETFLQTYQRLSIESRLHECLASDKWVRIIIHAMGSDDRIRYIGTLEDISDRKHMEDAVKAAHKENEEILQSISAILIGMDLQGRVKRWNSVAAQTFEITLASVLRQPLAQCGLQWEWDKVNEAIQQCCDTGHPQHVEDVKFTTHDDRERFLALTMNPIISGLGEGAVLKGVLILGKDLTEQRILERQLMQAQKLESIGQLAAGIAHEINTPIQFIGDNTRFFEDAFSDVKTVLDMCQDMLTDGEESAGKTQVERLRQAMDDADVEYLCDEVPKAISQTLEGVTRVSVIVQAMKQFSHPGVEGKTTVDLNHIVDSTVTVARNEWKYVAEVELELDKNLPPITCFASEISQVVLNLVVNAAHAIQETLTPQSTEHGTIRISTCLNGQYAEIRVKDSGVGIPEEYRSKIFDPFFTTKDVGKGTGQGLSIAYNVVQKHHGELTFESTVGEGTTFVVALPIAESDESIVALAESPEHASTVSE